MNTFSRLGTQISGARNFLSSLLLLLPPLPRNTSKSNFHAHYFDLDKSPSITAAIHSGTANTHGRILYSVVEHDKPNFKLPNQLQFMSFFLLDHYERGFGGFELQSLTFAQPCSNSKPPPRAARGPRQ